MKPVRIGVIGCGKQAVKHISGYKKIPGVTLVLADSRPSVARELGEKEGLAHAPGVRDILDDPSIDAVDICAPTSFHAPLIMDALSADKSFFCEKPLCETMDEARRIKEMAERKRLTGMVGYVYRFAPVFEFGKRLFQNTPSTGHSDALGKITFALFRLGGRGGHQLWKHLKSESGGAMSEMMVHMVDLAVWYFGRVKSARLVEKRLFRPERQVNGRVEKVDAEDFAMAQITMKSGVEVFIQADLLTPSFSQFIEVEGENGSFFGSIQQETPSFLFLEKPAGGYAAGRTELNYGYLNLFEAQMAEFVRAARAGEPAVKSSVDDSILLFEAAGMIEKGLK